MLLKNRICIVIALCCFSLLRAEKYALIIAIGNYPVKTGWSTISSINDISLIEQSLLNNTFLEENIFILKDREATKAGILNAFADLEKKLLPGDMVVIHYSGHGQQIFDDNGDEIDALDEAIIPYDAFATFSYNYNGENHIRDDELGRIMGKLRVRLGKKGQVLVLLDSCHSGTATRGGKARGTVKPLVPAGWVAKKNSSATSGKSGLFEQETSTRIQAPFVLISGASANELNYEYNGYGSLSYAFSKAMASLGSDFTFRQLFAKINAIMLQVSPKQTPTIEGDLDYTLFGGEYIKQGPYFKVTSIRMGKLLNVKGGTFQGLFEGTTVAIYPSGTNKMDSVKKIGVGKVIQSTLNEAVIEVDAALTEKNPGKLWVFVNQPTYGAMNLKVFVDASLEKDSVSVKIDNYLIKHELGNVVNDSLTADVIVEMNGSRVELRSTNGKAEIDAIESQRGFGMMDEVLRKLRTYSRGHYLRTLTLKNYDYEIEFSLLKLSYDSITDSHGDEISQQNSSKATILQMDTVNDRAILEVENKGNHPVFITIVEINSKGEICPFFPKPEHGLADDDRKLNPGKIMRFKDQTYRFGPPYERLTLKAFATPEPLDFSDCLTSSDTRGEWNPLETFFSIQTTRGGIATSADKHLEGFSTEFIYEIIEE